MWLEYLNAGTGWPCAWHCTANPDEVLVFCHRFASPLTDGALLCTGSSPGKNETREKERKETGRKVWTNISLVRDLPERWNRVSLPLAENHDVHTHVPLHETSLFPENRRCFATNRFYRENKRAIRQLTIERFTYSWVQDIPVRGTSTPRWITYWSLSNRVSSRRSTRELCCRWALTTQKLCEVSKVWNDACVNQGLPKTGHGISLRRAEQNDRRLVGLFFPATLQVTRQRWRFASDWLCLCRAVRKYSINECLPKTGHGMPLSRARQNGAGLRSLLQPTTP